MIVSDSYITDTYAVSLHFMHYNSCPIHQTLRITPVMAAGAEGDPERFSRIYANPFWLWVGDRLTWIGDWIGQFLCYLAAIDRALDPYQEDRFVVAGLLPIAALLLRGQMLQMHASIYLASVQRAAAARGQVPN